MSIKENLIAYLKNAAEPMRGSEIATEIGANKSTVAALLNALCAAGDVEAIDDGRAGGRSYVWAKTTHKISSPIVSATVTPVMPDSVVAHKEPECETQPQPIETESFAVTPMFGSISTAAVFEPLPTTVPDVEVEAEPTKPKRPAQVVKPKISGMMIETSDGVVEVTRVLGEVVVYAGLHSQLSLTRPEAKALAKMLAEMAA